jgi:ATP-binding protein involved in chromosome partitioning
MSSSLQEQVQQALENYLDPYLDITLGQAKALKAVRCEGSEVAAEIALGFPAAGYAHALSAALESVLSEVPGVTGSQIDVSWRIGAHSPQKSLEAISGIKNIVAVASGKGGVGKSTVASNLAIALSQAGAKVGMLDADIYGPSQQRMLGAEGRPETVDGKHMRPMVSHGIQSMSIGYLIEEETPMIWRGPMVTQALEQLLNETTWNDLDYLIVDLPPGTGDIQLTLAQRIPVSGAIIITTPQDIALLDARRAVKMFEKVEVAVLGIVENMSIHRCSNCGHEEHIFGSGGGTNMAEEYGIPLLGQLPLDINLRRDADAGEPTASRDADGDIATRFRDIALGMSAKLSLRPKDYSRAFGNIVLNPS